MLRRVREIVSVMMMMMMIIIINIPLVLRSQGSLKLTKQYKGGYDRQSVLLAAGKQH